MKDLTNKVKKLSYDSKPVPMTPQPKAAADVIDEARKLEDAGDAHAALAVIQEAEDRGNVMPFRELVRCVPSHPRHTAPKFHSRHRADHRSC